ncbi:hypothetical protein GGI24_000913 [Coemansia furcata]|nr:hypothetical protein GGI24_000913 [Coemansia furcata]
MSNFAEILVSARLDISTLKTFTLSLDEKIMQMSLEDLNTFLEEKMTENYIYFGNGFVLLNCKTKTPFIESPFANGDYTDNLRPVDDLFSLDVMATHLVKEISLVKESSQPNMD